MSLIEGNFDVAQSHFVKWIDVPMHFVMYVFFIFIIIIIILWVIRSVRIIAYHIIANKTLITAKNFNYYRKKLL